MSHVSVTPARFASRCATVVALAALPALAALAAVWASGVAHAAGETRESVTPAFSYPLANVPGKTVTGLIVSYPPGAMTPPHRHGKAFIVAYVLEGSIRSKLDNGEERVYKAGESWVEKPGAHHVVGRNESTTEPARLLAIFVADTGAKDLFVPDSAAKKK